MRRSQKGRLTGPSVFVIIAVLSGCRGGSAVAPVPALPATQQAASERAPVHAGLGATLTTKDGGQIFGFDIDQKGTDGVLATAQDVMNGGVRVSVEIFDQNTGAITSTFANQTGTVNEFVVDGIFAGDVALVTHFVTKKGSIFPTRHYEVMNPVTADKFTGKWTPPIANLIMDQTAENQATSKSVLFASDPNNQDAPILLVSDIAANTFSGVFHLDPNLFQGANGPQLGQYTAAGKAVIALSPDAGAVGDPGKAPVNVLIDLKTGAQTQFNGFNNGTFGSGFVNGLAVDPNTGVAATTTELNAQVEFYNLAKSTGITAVQLPCSGPEGQSNSGAGIAVDPVHKLFLVTDPSYACSAGSALLVYDEAGNLLETITGFKFAIAEPAPVVNPSKRIGWAFGPQFNQLRQFFY